MSTNGERDVAILGVGMHPWGKWGRDFTEYGMVAARAALDDAGLAWRDIEYVAGADTIRNGYPGFIAGATFAQKLGWTGVRVSSSYAACASGAQALHQARAQILAGYCDVALVIGADTPRRKGSSRRSVASAGPTPTGCASTCWGRPTRCTSRSTRGAGWTSTARPPTTSRASR